MNLLMDVCCFVLALVVFCIGLLCIGWALVLTVTGDKMGGALGIVIGFIAMGFALHWMDTRGML